MPRYPHKKKKKISFNVDREKYYFEVNDDTNIQNLLKMISIASSLDGINIQIFNDKKEYSIPEYQTQTLSSLFPTKDLISFKVIIPEIDPTENEDKENEKEILNKKENENIISDKKENKIQKSNYCALHFGKESVYFCYDCNKGMCTQCFVSGVHNDHNFKKEKLDCSENSTVMIEKIFTDLTLNLENIDGKFLAQIKDKMRIKIFPSLLNIVKEIEYKIVNIIEAYVKGEKDNLEKVNSICRSIRNIKGFKIKNDISIEEIFIDGNNKGLLKYNVFTEGDKVKEIIDNYKQFKKGLKIIGDSVEIIYNEIHSFLDKYLTNDLYEKAENAMKNCEDITYSKKNAFFKIIEAIKKEPKLKGASKKIKKVDIKKRNGEFYLDNKNDKRRRIYIDENNYKYVS